MRESLMAWLLFLFLVILVIIDEKSRRLGKKVRL